MLMLDVGPVPRPKPAAKRIHHRLLLRVVGYSRPRCKQISASLLRPDPQGGRVPRHGRHRPATATGVRGSLGETTGPVPPEEKGVAGISWGGQLQAEGAQAVFT